MNKDKIEKEYKKLCKVCPFIGILNKEYVIMGIKWDFKNKFTYKSAPKVYWGDEK